MMDEYSEREFRRVKAVEDRRVRDFRTAYLVAVACECVVAVALALVLACP
jgi:hypothetical protein